MARLAVDRARAWSALATNVAVLPGLGSLLLGRRVGWLQAPLALAGFVLTLAWLALVLSAWMQEGALPVGEVPRPRLLATGAALFACSWTWALATSLSALHARAPSAGE